MTTQQPFVPPAPSPTTTTTSTTTTTVCSATVVSNAMTLSAFKGVAKSIPGFSHVITAGNKSRARVTGYRIKDLPLVADGVLYLNNIAVVDEQLISPLDNGKLIYVPKADADSQASFNYLTETACGASSNAAVTINVSEKPDDCDCGSTSSTTTTTI